MGNSILQKVLNTTIFHTKIYITEIIQLIDIPPVICLLYPNSADSIPLKISKHSCCQIIRKLIKFYFA